MECLKPKKGHYLPDGTHQFGPSRNGHENEHDIPCGYCDVCLTNKAKLRGFKTFTNSLYIQASMFITLTHSDETLPRTQSGLPTLDKTLVPDFIKKLRFHINGRKKITDPDYKRIGVVYCGEYGDKDQRPHYHLIIFGYEFDDQRYWRTTKKGYPQYRSAKLDALWGLGNAEIGEVTPASCTYVASYIYKKQYGEKAKEHYQDRIPEYVVTPKKNFVIGREFIKNNIKHIAEQGCFKTIEGYSIGIDKHTLNWIEKEYPEEALKIKLLKESYDIQKMSKQQKEAKELTLLKRKELINAR